MCSVLQIVLSFTGEICCLWHLWFWLFLIELTRLFIYLCRVHIWVNMASARYPLEVCNSSSTSCISHSSYYFSHFILAFVLTLASIWVFKLCSSFSRALLRTTSSKKKVGHLLQRLGWVKTTMKNKFLRVMINVVAWLHFNPKVSKSYLFGVWNFC